MDTEYISIKDAIAKFKKCGIEFRPSRQVKSQRAELMQQIHEFYLKDKWVNDRKLCAKWLSRKKMKPTKENVEIWKKESKEFRKPITAKSLASFWLCHIPTHDLYYIVSIAKDKKERGESFNRWMFWSIKK